MNHTHRFYGIIKKVLILSVVLILASADTMAYAASDKNESGQKPDIIEESKARREKLQQSIENARTILDSYSDPEPSEDSLSMVRHSNGAAPISYKPHGQRYAPAYNVAMLNVPSGAPTVPEPVASQSIVKPETDQASDTSAASEKQKTNTTPNKTSSDGASSSSSSSTALTTESRPITSSAPIVESSNSAMSEKVRAVYNLIPASIRKDFEDNGWVIKITPQETIRKEDPWLGSLPTIFGIIAGLTVTNQNTIYLDDKYGEEATAHEMGHYVDMVLLGTGDWPPSFSDEFESIYESEKNGFNDDYPKSDAHEYFAETFALYIEYAGSLQQDFPRTYDYMDRLISPYGGTTTKDKVMTKDEKDDRYGIDFAEAFNFDEAYGSYLKEIQKMIEKGLNSPATKRATDRLKESGKSLIDDIIRDYNKVKNEMKRVN